ncbi:MAG: adenylate kinase, partial [Clostridia bacterium]|nr:adenylate kinase [Clostridia bacterium]
MIILISGATHTGKTALAQKLMEKYKIPYYSLDHLKMGLIRSGQTSLTVYDDEKLTTYLWSIVKEIIKTAIENKQNLIIEGCYIPFDWQKDFSKEYLNAIKYYCLVMTENYIENDFTDILKFENVIEQRLCDDITKAELIDDNTRNLQLCKEYNLNYI